MEETGDPDATSEGKAILSFDKRGQVQVPFIFPPLNHKKGANNGNDLYM